jgi:hypothetical protein
VLAEAKSCGLLDCGWRSWLSVLVNLAHSQSYEMRRSTYYAARRTFHTLEPQSSPMIQPEIALFCPVEGFCTEGHDNKFSSSVTNKELEALAYLSLKRSPAPGHHERFVDLHSLS